MDIVLAYGDEYFMNKVYKQLPAGLYENYFANESSLIHQATTLWVVTSIAGFFLYFLFSIVSFYTLFDRNLLNHPKFLPGQIKREIYMSLFQIPLGSLYTIPFWLLEINGMSKIYYNVEDHGWPYLAFSVVAFLVFSDFLIYWIHRIEHHPSLYSWLHKPHHTWKVPTPFSSFAFHPLVSVLVTVCC